MTVHYQTMTKYKRQDISVSLIPGRGSCAGSLDLRHGRSAARTLEAQPVMYIVKRTGFLVLCTPGIWDTRAGAAPAGWPRSAAAPSRGSRWCQSSPAGTGPSLEYFIISFNIEKNRSQSI